MHDLILARWLERQLAEGQQLAAGSDLFALQPLLFGPPPVSHFLAGFRCKGLVRSASGEVSGSDDFSVGIHFPADYLRRAETAEVLTWLAPAEIFHPNIHHPFICVGRLAPGTPLVEIVYQVFEIITFTKVAFREDDALNRDACAWARRNRHRFPVDDRPLKRRSRPADPAGSAPVGTP